MPTDNQQTQDTSSTETTDTTQAADGGTSTETETSTSDLHQQQQQTDDTSAADLAVIPDKVDGYSFKFSEKAQGLVGDLASDPLVSALKDHALANKWPVSRFQDLAVAIEVAAEKGLIEAPLDNVAEMGRLGSDGIARQGELETYLQALQAREDIDADMFGEAMILSRTAAGVKMLEWMRKQTPNEGRIDPPSGENGGQGGESADQTKAREMARDPRYSTDRAFAKEADAFWMKAFA